MLQKKQTDILLSVSTRCIFESRFFLKSTDLVLVKQNGEQIRCILSRHFSSAHSIYAQSTSSIKTCVSPLEKLVWPGQLPFKGKKRWFDWNRHLPLPQIANVFSTTDITALVHHTSAGCSVCAVCSPSGRYWLLLTDPLGKKAVVQMSHWFNKSLEYIRS